LDKRDLGETNHLFSCNQSSDASCTPNHYPQSRNIEDKYAKKALTDFATLQAFFVAVVSSKL